MAPFQLFDPVLPSQSLPLRSRPLPVDNDPRASSTGGFRPFTAGVVLDEATVWVCADPCVEAPCDGALEDVDVPIHF